MIEVRVARLGHSVVTKEYQEPVYIRDLMNELNVSLEASSVSVNGRAVTTAEFMLRDGDTVVIGNRKTYGASGDEFYTITFVNAGSSPLDVPVAEIEGKTIASIFEEVSGDVMRKVFNGQDASIAKQYNVSMNGMSADWNTELEAAYDSKEVVIVFNKPYHGADA